MTLPIAAAKIAAPIVMGLAGNVLGKLAQATGDSARTAAAKSAPSGGIVEAGMGKSRDFAQALEKRLAALPPHQAEKIRKTAQDFEASFLENTLERMFASAGEEGPLGDNGTGGSTWRSMLTNEYAKSIAASGGVGIARPVMAEMLRIQEAANGGRS